MELGFLVKKFIGACMMPLALSLMLLTLGLMWSKLRPQHAHGRRLITASGIVLFLFSWNPIGDRLLYALEHHYPALSEIPNVEYVVVLGGKVSSDSSVPMSSHLSSDARARIMEGVRLAQALPNAKLIVSGYAGFNTYSCAEIYSFVAQDMGIASSRIITLTTPKDTEEEAIAVKALVGEDAIALVTSASHMRRAMNFFNAVNIVATPAPTFFTAKPNASDWSFGSDGLYKSERAIYEYAGLLWQSLK